MIGRSEDGVALKLLEFEGFGAAANCGEFAIIGVAAALGYFPGFFTSLSVGRFPASRFTSLSSSSGVVASSCFR